jgi:aspartate aminotransferase
MVAADVDQDFDLDVEAIRKAITPKTRMLLLNSPNNRTGKIYAMIKTLKALPLVLREANNEREAAAIIRGDRSFLPIMVVSDEAYNRIVFDNIDYHSIAEVSPYSLMVYTWGKTLLAPSERFGYISFSPLVPLPLRKVMCEKALGVVFFPTDRLAKLMPR